MDPIKKFQERMARDVYWGDRQSGTVLSLKRAVLNSCKHLRFDTCHEVVNYMRDSRISFIHCNGWAAKY